tara:strand:- start:26 stop:274 length:249 start_codon:yes stop_codon:yes gene_type:complete
MALTKNIEIDKIEIVGEYKNIQVREATIIKEDDTELSRSFHRYALSPDADLTGQPQEIIDIANIMWTDEIKAAYQASLEIVG